MDFLAAYYCTTPLLNLPQLVSNFLQSDSSCIIIGLPCIVCFQLLLSFSIFCIFLNQFSVFLNPTFLCTVVHCACLLLCFFCKVVHCAHSVLAALFLALLFTLLLPCACHPPPAGGAAATKSQETENLLSKITNPNPKYRYKYRVQILIQIHFTRPLVNKIRRNFRKSQPNYFQKSQIRKRNTYTFTYIQTDTSSLKHYGLQTKLLYQNEDIEVVLSAKGARTK